MMKALLYMAIAASGLSPQLGHTQSAPFCVVSSAGYQQCSYHNLALCQSVARSQGGACVYQGAAQQQPANFADAMAQGAMAGSAMKRQREAAERPAQLNGTTKVYVFRCTGEDGKPVYVTDGLPGCIVVSVVDL